MNKDVLYIASEDDISDVVQKIENAKNKIIALVPPANDEIFHSLINMKLVNKTARSAGKTAVFVTTDKTIINLAATLHIPVAKDLKSAPVTPTEPENSLSDNTKEDESVSPEIFDQFKKASDSEKTPIDAKSKKGEAPKAEKKIKEPSEGFLGWLSDHKKIIIPSIIAVALLALFTVWAIVFAPAATIDINIKTTSKAFSSNVTFTTTAADEDITSGKFYLEEKKIETSKKIEFQATGSKNIGEKAKGSLSVTVAFGNLLNVSTGTYTLREGSAFTHDGLKYVTTTDLTITVKSDKDCSNYDANRTVAEAEETSCLATGEVSIIAAELGEKYNINGPKQDWSSNDSDLISIQNSNPISGGTDKVITVVSEDDVKKAKETLNADTTTDTEAKKTILAQITEGSLAINSSFKKTVSELEVYPAIDSEVADGVTPYISQTTTMTINYVDSVRIEEFIRSSAQLASDQKIYSVGEPFIENFNSDSNSGKLKTTYTYGPKVTAEEILEKVKGKKIGEVKALLNSINGITSSINTSYFWVNSIPDDPNKITINVNTADSE